jgi:beta-hydroxylase
MLIPLLGVSLKPFYGREDFPWLSVLEENYDGIRKEMLALYAEKFILPVKDLNKNVAVYIKDDQWKVFNLWVYGHRIDKNCELCPYTESILKKIPHFHSAFFSLLQPHKNIAAHRGVYRGNLLAHLGLVVPEDFTEYTLYVKDAAMHWKEGRAFAFEDSFVHSVENNSESFRAVLIVEFKREVPLLLKPFDWHIQRTLRSSYITHNILKVLAE